MDIQDIRRAVLRTLIRKNHDNVVRQFAAVVKKPDGQLNDMLSTPPRKSFGERVARAIEKAYGLVPGYLDQVDNAVLNDGEYETIRQKTMTSAEPENKVVYGTFNSAITEVIELMQGVDAETQRDILGSARVASSQYRIKLQNSTKRAGQ